MRSQKDWDVKGSCFAKKSFNPIRNIVENMRMNPNSEKPMIALSLGDPAIFGNLQPSKEIIDSVIESTRSCNFNGYAPSTGYKDAREAVAKYCSSPQSKVEAQDIAICSGCSCALDISIAAICSPGTNILIPRPGFPLYRTLAEGLGIETRSYDLLPNKNWEIDIPMLEELVDKNTAAIIVNNPSNPCGSVYSKVHLQEILKVAERNKVPIIADEIYENFVFEGEEFHWLASLSERVPILSCGGLTKRFLVPGWRTGWIVIHDRNGIFAKEIRQAILNLSQRIVGSNTLVQGALPKILLETHPSFFSSTISVVQRNARLCFEILNSAEGLKPIMPQGAMYMMIGVEMENFPEFKNDLKFVENMISEESVFCLPGQCFSTENFFRVVLTVPEELLKEACQRIKEFCNRHYKLSQVSNGHISNIINEADYHIDSFGLNALNNKISAGKTKGGKDLPLLKLQLQLAEYELDGQ